MKTLYTTHYGSHLYGTATPGSDVDFKHIVLPSLDTLLLNKQLKNVVKNTNTGKNTSNDVDNEYINIQTFANAFLAGQTYALEVAFSVLSANHTLKTIHEPMFVDFVKELTSKYLTNNMSALIGYAVNQANMYSLKGSRFNTITELHELLSTVEPTLVFDACTQEFKDKIAEFSSRHPRHFYLYTENGFSGYELLSKKLPFNSDMKQWLSTVSVMLTKYGTRSAESSTGVDWKATMHAVRIAHQGLELLTNKHIEFPLNATVTNRLLEIRKGNIELSVISAELADAIDKIHLLHRPNDHINHDEFNAWLASWMRKFYNLDVL